MSRHAFSVAVTQQGMRLDRFLARFLAQSLPDQETDQAKLSRTQIARLIEQGAVTVDRTPTKTRSLLLRAGQEVSLILAARGSPSARDQACSAHGRVERKEGEPSATLEVLYEDEHLLCFVKPAGLTTHPAPSVRGETLVARLVAHCAPHLAGYPEDPRCGIVHRLDKDTSGVMVAAKTEQTRLRLAAQFARHDLERLYLALVWGVPTLLQDKIETALARHPVQRTKWAVPRDNKQGKGRNAVTHYRLVEAFGKVASLQRCRLETGRTHQIRAHMSSIGHPVIGDPLYGEKNPCPQRRVFANKLPAMARQALHAERLGFVHPIDARPLCFTAPPPRDFQVLLEALRRQTDNNPLGISRQTKR